MVKRDLYDSNRGRIDKFVKMGEKIEKGYFCLTNIIFILNSKGEILITKNNKNLSFIYNYPKASITGRNSVIEEVKNTFNVNVDKKELMFFKTIKTENEFIDLYLIKKDISYIKENMKWIKLKKIYKLIENGQFTNQDIHFYKYLLEFIKSGNIDVIKRITCKGIIIENDEIILMYRNKNNDIYYVVPGGGVEYNETLEETVIRELKEEVNADAEVVEYIGKEENETTVYHFFRCRKTNNDLKIIGPEKDRITDDNYYEIRKVKKQELKKYKVYGINAIMRAFEK